MGTFGILHTDVGDLGAVYAENSVESIGVIKGMYKFRRFQYNMTT